MGIAAPAAGAEDVEMETASEGLPADALAAIEELSGTLSASRKKRKAPAGYTTPAKLKTFTPKHTVPSLHSASPAGITSIALSTKNPSQFLTAGNDKVVQLYDRESDKVLASLKGHTKKINQVAFREKEGEPTLLLSAGADKIAKVWSYDEPSSEYVPKSTIRSHKGDVTGLGVHPTSTYLTLSSTDKTFSVHDLSTFAQIFRSVPGEEALTSLSIHPDGTLVAFGTPGSSIQIYDIRAGALAASLSADSTPFAVNSLSFSENGYHLAAPSSSSTVAIWDLRKQKKATDISLGDDFNVHKVRYDFSAQYLAVAGSLGGRIFANKSWDELLRLEEGGDMSDIVFGPEGKEIWGTTGREVRIWGL